LGEFPGILSPSRRLSSVSANPDALSVKAPRMKSRWHFFNQSFPVLKRLELVVIDNKLAESL
jgi:hypothetical protein